MVDRGLRRVEELRQRHAEQRRLELASALREETACRAVHQAALALQRECERRLERSLRAFASAGTVAALRGCSRLTEVAQRERRRAVEQSARAANACAAAAARVLACRETWSSAERDRLAVTRALAQRSHDVSLRTERRQEDELEDAVRGRLSH